MVLEYKKIVEYSNYEWAIFILAVLIWSGIAWGVGFASALELNGLIISKDLIQPSAFSALAVTLGICLVMYLSIDIKRRVYWVRK
jgi:hypothetical protein